MGIPAAISLVGLIWIAMIVVPIVLGAIFYVIKWIYFED